MGQILNILSSQPVDALAQKLIEALTSIAQQPPDRTLSLSVLLGLIFLATVAKAPIQPWLGVWFHWLIPLKARRDQGQTAIAKILTLQVVTEVDHALGQLSQWSGFC